MSGTRIGDHLKRLAWACVFAATLSAPALSQYGVRPGGQRNSTLGTPWTKAVALFFVASDCPVSDKTFPEMTRIREEFGGRGVAVWFVYPNSTEHAAEVERHQQEFDAGGGMLLDPKGELVRLSGAKVTPEVSVLVPTGAGSWKPVYTGRVDDRFVHLGVERQKVTEHFAEMAIDAVLTGRPVLRATGTPVGCGIVSAGTQR